MLFFTLKQLCLLCRSWRVVSACFRPVPVAGGGPGEADPDHRHSHTGTLWQLRLVDQLYADVQ